MAKQGSIPAEERFKLWVRAGGRCEICNRYLLEGQLAYRELTFGEAAHIIGRKETARSPRGLEGDLQVEDRDDADNLMDVTIARALGILNGQALASIEVDPRTGGSRFAFDLGCALLTHPAPAGSYDDEPVEQWSLYLPSGTVLTVRGDGCYAMEPSGTPEASAIWRPLPDG